MSGKKSRNKGATFERLIRNYLRLELDEEVPNPAASGFAGGDAQVRGFDIEIKNHATPKLAEWWRQAREQTDPTKFLPVLVHKRHGVSEAGAQWVTMDLQTFVDIVSRMHD